MINRELTGKQTEEGWWDATEQTQDNRQQNPHNFLQQFSEIYWKIVHINIHFLTLER